jgi:predicted nucleic acid-binding protein
VIRTAVDSSVLLDVVAGDVPSAGRAAEALQNARAEGELLVCECVIAEIAPEISVERLSEFLSDWGIRFVPSSAESAQRAGRMFAEYLRRGAPARARGARFPHRRSRVDFFRPVAGA